MIEFSAEITPHWHSVARQPPGSEKHVQQEEYSQNAAGPDPDSEQHRDPNCQFDNPDDVSEKHRMLQHKVPQYRAIETHRTVGDIVLQVILESTVGKARAGHFIFAKKKKENRRCDPNGGDRP